MKITKAEAIDLGIIDQLIDMNDYDFYSFMERSDDDHEFELTIEQFNKLTK